MHKRIFISAANEEFGQIRTRLAALLQRAGLNVEHQDIFPQTASDTVRKLGDLIKKCALLIHMVGHKPGTIACESSVNDLLNKIPRASFLTRFPSLKKDLGDLTGITYTQWEAFLALHHGVAILLYVPCDACEPGTKVVNNTFAQKPHLDRLHTARPYPEFCSDETDFIGKIQADVYRHFGIRETELPSVIPHYLPGRNPNFRGRKSDLAHLRKALDCSETIGITQQVAILASGGVGKSSLAIEFGWESIEADPPKFLGGVFWCDCRGRDLASLADALATLSGPLGIDVGESNDPLPAARLVRDRLTSGPPSLLILDNVLDTEQWKNKEWIGLLPNGYCRRLLTTREENLGDHRLPMIRLACLSIQDARELLHAYRDDVSLEDKDDAVKAIINWFGGLAIGLTVVGIYLGLNPYLTWDAYWQSLKDVKLDTVRETEELASPADYTNRVDAVIDDLFDSQSLAEKLALLYASVLPGNDASDRWLIELLSDDMIVGRINGKTPPGYQSHPHYVVDNLLRRGIIHRMIDTTARKTVFLHQVIRERLSELLRQNDDLCNYVSEHVRQFGIRNYKRSCQWTQAIVESPVFSEAQKLFDSMVQAGCDPNVFTFTTLLSKADTYADANYVFELMRAAGEKPNVYTFTTLLSKTETYAEAKAVFAQMRAEGQKPNEFTFNTLLSKAETYAEAKDVFAQMRAEGQKPDVVTFNTLLSKAETYAEAKDVFAQMRAEGEKPDVYSFTTLLSKAETYAEAKDVFAQMRAEGEKPNEFTFTTLLSKAESYVEAKDFVMQMQAEGMRPNHFILTTLFSKKDEIGPVKEVLDWYYTLIYHPADPLNALIARLREMNRVSEAMQVVLQHPYLSSSVKLMRDFPDTARELFLTAQANESSHPTANFALGILAKETNHLPDAKAYLEEALNRAKHPKQMKTIQSMLKLLG